MRIAMVSPLLESVPPRVYGGAERLVSHLTEALVAMGEHVTLFATADSMTRARLRPAAVRGLRRDTACRDPLPYHVAMLQDVMDHAHEFDVLHFHTSLVHFPMLKATGLPALTTMHGRLDQPGLGAMLQLFPEAELVSVSDAQRAAVQRARWLATVRPGLPRDDFAPGSGRSGDLAFVGRPTPEGGLERAIAIARRAGRRLRVASPAGTLRQERRRSATVHPLPGVDFVGPLADRAARAGFLGEAAALLYPIDWPEPSGLELLEAMACGTPVVATRRGSVPELVAPGITGFVADDEDHAVAAVRDAVRLDRGECRRHFEAHFTAQRMAREYHALYRRVARSEPAAARRAL